jgi:hypothetical protein
LLRDALKGELEVCCAALSGDRLLVYAAGGLKMIFLLEDPFLIGRRGEEDLVVVD